MGRREKWFGQCSIAMDVDGKGEGEGEGEGGRRKRTSAAAAALLRASPAADPPCSCDGPPPSVRGGPPTLTDLGTEAVPAGAGAEPTGRPWPAKLSDEALLQRLPMLRSAEVEVRVISLFNGRRVGYGGGCQDWICMKLRGVEVGL